MDDEGDLLLPPADMCASTLAARASSSVSASATRGKAGICVLSAQSRTGGQVQRHARRGSG